MKIPMPHIFDIQSTLGSKKIDVLDEILAEQLTTDPAFAAKFAAYTGIKTAYVLDETETILDLCVRVCAPLIKRYPKINMVCVVTQSYSPRCPGLGYALHEALGLNEDIPVVEINAACQGWVQAIASLANEGRYVLLVSADQLGTMARSQKVKASKNVRYLFSDAASACVVHYSSIKSEYFSSLYPKARKSLEFDSSYMFMEGEDVSTLATSLVPSVLKKFDERTSVFMHQPNWTMLDRIEQRSRRKIHKCVDKYANCTSSSVPVAVCDWAKENMVPYASVLCGFGAGFSVEALEVRIEGKHLFV